VGVSHLAGLSIKARTAHQIAIIDRKLDMKLDQLMEY